MGQLWESKGSRECKLKKMLLCNLDIAVTGLLPRLHYWLRKTCLVHSYGEGAMTTLTTIQHEFKGYDKISFLMGDRLPYLKGLDFFRQPGRFIVGAYV